MGAIYPFSSHWTLQSSDFWNMTSRQLQLALLPGPRNTSFWVPWIQVPQVASNLNCSYGRRDFILPVLVLRFSGLRDVGMVITSDNNWGKNTQPNPWWSLILPPINQEGGFINLSFLINKPLGTFLVILHIPCQFLLWLCLTFSDPIPLKPCRIPCILSSVSGSIACISFLGFSLTRRSLFFHSDLLHSLPACWNNGNLSCFMKKKSVMTFQNWFAFLSLRTISWESCIVIS